MHFFLTMVTVHEDNLEFHSHVFLYKIHVSVVLESLTPFYRKIISGIIFRAAMKFVFLSKPVVAFGLKQLAGNGGTPNRILWGNRHPWKVMVILPA